MIGRAPCDATLVKLGPQGTYGEGDVLVLVGEGPHAPVAARRAGELVAAAEGEGSLTLYNVQHSADGDAEEESAPRDRGEALVEEVVEQAGLEYMAYETRIEEADDVEEAVLGVIDEYDTVCVGATRTGVISQALFGSLPEMVGEQSDGTVLMARGPDESPISIREAIVRRLDV